MIRAKAEVEALTPYVAPLEGRRPFLRLDFNESTVGPSPRVLEAIRSLPPDAYAAYPEYAGLNAAYEERFGFRFVVFVNGRSKPEIVEELKVRMERPRAEELVEFIAEFHQLPSAQFVPHLYQKADREMVEHLFLVASSLDSMVLGETQILGQVRGAYELAGESQLVVVPGAGHLFEEPGALEKVAALARDWFLQHL